MKILRLIILLVFGLTCTTVVDAQNMQARKMVRKGNRLFRSNQQVDAMKTYYRGLNADSTDARINYNLGTAAMLPENWKTIQDTQKRDSMILNWYNTAIENETNKLRRSKAHYNKGVFYQNAHDFANAIEAYKNALRDNPNDDEARYNLEVCRHQLDKNNDGGGQNNQDQQDQQEQQEKQQQEQPQEQKQDQQDDQQQPQEPPMSKENAEQLLNAAMQREKETQKRVNEHQQPQRRRIEKNW